MNETNEVTITGLDGREPRWVLWMAKTYAAERSLGELNIDVFYFSPEYKSQVERNLAALDRIAAADINANR